MEAYEVTGRIDPRELLHNINIYGYGEWHRGYVAGRAHTAPHGPEGDRWGVAVLGGEDEGNAEREAWAYPLVALLDLDGADRETREGLILALSRWGQAMHGAGWYEVVGPFPDDRPLPLSTNPVAEHDPEHLAASRARWETPLLALLARHFEAPARAAR